MGATGRMTAGPQNPTKGLTSNTDTRRDTTRSHTLVERHLSGLLFRSSCGNKCGNIKHLCPYSYGNMNPPTYLRRLEPIIRAEAGAPTTSRKQYCLPST